MNICICFKRQKENHASSTLGIWCHTIVIIILKRSIGETLSFREERARTATTRARNDHSINNHVFIVMRLNEYILWIHSCVHTLPGETQGLSIIPEMKQWQWNSLHHFFFVSATEIDSKIREKSSREIENASQRQTYQWHYVTWNSNWKLTREGRELRSRINSLLNASREFLADSGGE
jgi:hypothetical protein